MEPSKLHTLHRTIEAALKEDVVRREIGSFYVRVAKTCTRPHEGPEGEIRNYWLRGNFWREEVTFPAVGLDQVIEIDMRFYGSYQEGEIGPLTINFAGRKDGKEAEYETGARLMVDGTSNGYRTAVMNYHQLSDASAIDWLRMRLLLDFDLGEEMKADHVREVTDGPARKVGPLREILRHLHIDSFERIKDDQDITLPFLRSLPAACFNRPVAIMYDHFAAQVYSLERFDDKIYVRAHTGDSATTYLYR